MAKRVTYAQIKSFTPEQLSKLNLEESRELLLQMRQKYEYRRRAFARAGSNVYSPAAEKMEEYYRRVGKSNVNEMNIWRARSELFQLQDFFKSRTSDVKGAREVMCEQDARIFGVGKSGRPKYRMTKEERDRFWADYEEFLNTFKNYEQIYGSDKIQQYLGEIAINNRSGGSGNGTIGLMQRLSSLEKMLREKEGPKYVTGRNVRQGR